MNAELANAKRLIATLQAENIELRHRTNLDAATIPLCDDEELPHYDPLWVMTLWHAYKALLLVSATETQSVMAGQWINEVK